MVDVRFWQSVSAVLALTLCASALIGARAAVRLREARIQHAFAMALVDTTRRTLDETMWLTWWVRCACETPHHDGAREALLRWAIAGACATSRDQLHCDLQRIATDPKRSEVERVHAQAFAAEIAFAREHETTPWREWAKQDAVRAGQPVHNPHALQAAYHAALDGWQSLLPCVQEIAPNSLQLVSVAPKPE